ncbi:MAG: DNA polymerase I [Lachnospiraceae bacterium]|nr:DNA polymerase I [Lachnospiraceae bacterium]
MNKLLLIDGNSILNRAFYGLPDLTTADGRHTNAVLGFLNIIFKVIDEEKATHICVAFDLKEPTFRHKMYSEYKGTRHAMPDELREQVPLIKEVLESMNITTISKAGYEADDILGTLSRAGENEGYEITVLSGDRDLLQLATDKILIKIPKTKGGKTEIFNYYAKDVEAEYGVTPTVFIDMKGLMGDSSDNIPGVPGVGPKSASKLLVEYGSMDGLYEHIDELKKSKMKDNLVEFKEQAYLSKELATIKLDCELDADISKMTYSEAFNKNSYKLFSELEFKSLLGRFDDSEKMASELRFEIKLVDDLTSFNKIFDREFTGFGFSFIENVNELLGASICDDENNVYLVRIGGEISKDLINGRIISLLKNGKSIYSLDIKKTLGIIDIRPEYKIIDCSIGAYLLNPLKEHYDYDDIAREYLGISLLSVKELVGKNEINMFSFEDENISKYFAYRSIIPYMAGNIVIERLKADDMYKLYEDIELPCVFSLYEMEKNGIRVDAAALKEYGERLKENIDKLTKEIYELAGEEFNINSTKQLGEILFEKLGLKSGKKTKTGYSTSVEVLEKLRNEHPIIDKILDYRQLTKLNSTYVEGMSAYIMPDGRIHGTFNQTVTATGRISSTEPNLQNIPTRLPLGREIRKVFIPEDGYVFLDADYSQIELRVLAHLSNDEALLNAYKKDTDIHTVTASEVFGVPLDEVDSLMRRKAKAVNFGIVYGISSFGLGQDLDISRKEAEGYINKYFETYKKVKEYLDDTVEYAKEHGYSITMFNRRRPIPELKSSNFMTRSFGERCAKNSPIQGTAADIIKIAMINVDKELKRKNLKSRLILQVHDELLIETKEEELDEVREILLDKMMNATSLSVPLVVDMHDGGSWYDAK